MKNNISNDGIDSIDNLLYNLAQKDYAPIPEEIHNNIIKTIENIDSSTNFSNESKIKKHNHFSFKSKFKELPNFTFKSNLKKHHSRSFKRKFGTIITSPGKTIAIAFLVVLLISTGMVGARNMSEKFFNKNHVRLDGIGIANEFIYTDEMEKALIQNVPLKLVQLDDNYYINVYSILLNEINFFTTFELHSKSGVTDDLRFIIRDLKITDENENVLYCSNLETNNNKNSGYNHIYNMENSIKELFFMFGKDNSKIKELNFSFSDIDIYKYDKQLNANSNFTDININCEEQNINIPITKNNYNTIQEYVLENENIENDYKINKAIYTNTGLHILAECEFNTLYPIIKTDINTYLPTYKIPIKRLEINKILMLYAYNIKSITDNNINIYNDSNKEKYTLIQKN